MIQTIEVRELFLVTDRAGRVILDIMYNDNNESDDYVIHYTNKDLAKCTKHQLIEYIENCDVCELKRYHRGNKFKFIEKRDREHKEAEYKKHRTNMISIGD